MKLQLKNNHVKSTMYLKSQQDHIHALTFFTKIEDLDMDKDEYEDEEEEESK